MTCLEQFAKENFFILSTALSFCFYGIYCFCLDLLRKAQEK